MRKYTGLIIFILLASVVVAGCASDTEGSGVQEVKARENIPITEDNSPQEQATPTKGSYQNPAGINESVLLSSTGSTYEVAVVKVIRGTEANYVIKNENQFNEEPAPGNEYVLVGVGVAYSKGDEATYISPIDFKAFCEGVEYQQSYVVLPNDFPEFSSGNVMPGAVKGGWLVYEVPQGKEVIMSYQPNMFDESTAYISIGK